MTQTSTLHSMANKTTWGPLASCLVITIVSMSGVASLPSCSSPDAKVPPQPIGLTDLGSKVQTIRWAGGSDRPELDILGCGYDPLTGNKLPSPFELPPNNAVSSDTRENVEQGYQLVEDQSSAMAALGLDARFSFGAFWGKACARYELAQEASAASMSTYVLATVSGTLKTLTLKERVLSVPARALLDGPGGAEAFYRAYGSSYIYQAHLGVDFVGSAMIAAQSASERQATNASLGVRLGAGRTQVDVKKLESLDKGTRTISVRCSDSGGSDTLAVKDLATLEKKYDHYLEAATAPGADAHYYVRAVSVIGYEALDSRLAGITDRVRQAVTLADRLGKVRIETDEELNRVEYAIAHPAEFEGFDSSVAVQERDQIAALVAKIEEMATQLKEHPLTYVLASSDVPIPPRNSLGAWKHILRIPIKQHVDTQNAHGIHETKGDLTQTRLRPGAGRAADFQFSSKLRVSGGNVTLRTEMYCADSDRSCEEIKDKTGHSAFKPQDGRAKFRVWDEVPVGVVPDGYDFVSFDNQKDTIEFSLQINSGNRKETDPDGLFCFPFEGSRPIRYVNGRWSEFKATIFTGKYPQDLPSIGYEGTFTAEMICRER